MDRETASLGILVAAGFAAVAAIAVFGVKAQAWAAGKLLGAIDLISVDGHLAERLTGTRFLEMQKAARAAGIRLALTSGFRSNEKQAELRRKYEAELAEFQAGKRATKPTPAAKPGFSNHQNGIALDIAVGNDPLSAEYRWLEAHAARWGFVNTGRHFSPPEYWHWERKS